MFKKVLVAEDIDSINIGITAALKKEFTFSMVSASYCDNAFLKLKKSILDNDPFDLMITDLSFKKDHRIAKIQSGEELIAKVKNMLPSLKVIIYSIEDRAFKINEYLNYLEVDAYVLKGRNSSQDLIKAIRALEQNKTYVSRQLSYKMQSMPALEIDNYDIRLIKALANGLSQQEIALLFKKQNVTPSSLSSIEKRINKLKDYFMAKNTTHLIAIAKDMGLF